MSARSGCSWSNSSTANLPHPCIELARCLDLPGSTWFSACFDMGIVQMPWNTEPPMWRGKLRACALLGKQRKEDTDTKTPLLQPPNHPYSYLTDGMDTAAGKQSRRALNAKKKKKKKKKGPFQPLQLPFTAVASSKGPKMSPAHSTVNWQTGLSSRARVGDQIVFLLHQTYHNLSARLQNERLTMGLGLCATCPHQTLSSFNTMAVAVDGSAPPMILLQKQCTAASFERKIQRKSVR